MSPPLISRNLDLARLREDGYELEIRSGFLLVHNVPYVNGRRQIRRGTLISSLDLAGDETVAPTTHVALFTGEYPCDQDGVPIVEIRHQSTPSKLADDLTAEHSFSAKPKSGKYADYYEKMTTYAAIISGPAEAIDGSLSARTFAFVESIDDDSVFKYVDTFSSRAKISAIGQKLAIPKVAIVGLGGTGSYILDLVAKTPVREIHLFDGDVFLQHNAFRAPGAASVESLRKRPQKVDYFYEMYSAQRRGIVPHDEFMHDGNISELLGMDFVFLSMDGGGVKRKVVRALEDANIPFIDVGMGVEKIGDMLIGVMHVTTSTEGHRKHVWDKQRIPLNDDKIENEYSNNIQIGDLNALNAALAVIRWKKVMNFYQDLEGEFFSTYSINVNMLTSEDQGNEVSGAD